MMVPGQPTLGFAALALSDVALPLPTRLGATNLRSAYQA